MYLRLAFSVSIHLDPDILLIDEVFAVGDQDFQRKCMRRLAKAREDGQTIVLVSHAMNIIAEQCRTAIWLNRGKLVQYGDAGDIISSYIGSQGRQGDGTASASEKGLIIGAGMTVFDPPGGIGGLSLDRLYIGDSEGNHVHSVDYNKPFSLVYEYRVHESLENLKAGVLFSGADHSRIVHATSGDTISAHNNPLGEVGTHRLSVPFPARWFKPGAYTLEVSITSLNGGVHFYERNSLNIYIDGPTFDAVYDEIMHPTLDWAHTRVSDEAGGQIASADDKNGAPRGAWW
jgi:hypothetical protein